MTLKEYFEQHPCASLKEAAAQIEELIGLKRSIPQVEKFLKKMGLKCRKVGCLPAKADPDHPHRAGLPLLPDALQYLFYDDTTRITRSYHSPDAWHEENIVVYLVF